MSTLKELAKEAKRRMLSNAYQTKIQDDKTCAEEECAASMDKSMEGIVEDIIASTEIVVDPIGRLVDQEYFSTLGEVERERYILALAEKYQNLRKKVNF